MSAIDRDPFPRAPLIAAAALVAMVMVAAWAGRNVLPRAPLPIAPAVAERQLRFVDQSDGGIAVLDAGGGRKLAEILPGQDGFTRALMRGLAGERARRGDGLSQDIETVPFRLVLWSDGRLTLDDPLTQRHVELEAFGPANMARFSRFLATGAEGGQGS